MDNQRMSGNGSASGNGHVGNGHVGNGHVGNGHVGNGHVGNGHVGNGSKVKGHHDDPSSLDGVQRVLVVGGAGYVGGCLIPKLLSRGYQVRVFDALVYGDDALRPFYGHPGFEVVKGDLRDLESMVRALRHTDAVVHLGALVGDPACALDEGVTLAINLDATRTLALAARGMEVRRMVFASTCSVYGASDDFLDEDSPLDPVSVYARSKMESERLLLELVDDTFAPIVLRFGTFYGLSPRARFDLVVNMLAAKAVVEGKITVFGGEQWRPFLHVEDGANAILACLEAPEGSVRGQVFNVGSDEQNYTLSQIAEEIAGLVPGADVVRLPAADVEANYRVSFTRIREHLGFLPSYTLADGIREVKQAIDLGMVSDYQDERYSNYKTLVARGGIDVQDDEEPVRAEAR
jgi:nucleoside-diphosphate-sugar epimerase